MDWRALTPHLRSVSLLLDDDGRNFDEDDAYDPDSRKYWGTAMQKDLMEVCDGFSIQFSVKERQGESWDRYLERAGDVTSL
jgi:hypothetical protein